MLIKKFTGALAVAGLALAFGTVSVGDAHADNDALKGAVIGAGVGALVGGKEGAVVGGVGGAIIGANK